MGSRWGKVGLVRFPDQTGTGRLWLLLEPDATVSTKVVMLVCWSVTWAAF